MNPIDTSERLETPQTSDQRTVVAHAHVGRDVVERFALPIVWLLVIIVFSFLRPTIFFTWGNFATMFGTQAVLVVLTLALLVPLVAGDYDLSCAYNLTLSAMVVALLNVNHHVSIYLSIIAALSCGAVIGLVNGALILYFNIDSLIVTLGTGTFISGVVLWISASQTISGVSSKLVDPVVIDTLFGISYEFYYSLALCLILWYVLEFTPIGRRLLFVGRGRTVSRLSGINVVRVRLGGLVASGVLAAGAGVLYAGTTGAADPTSGASFLLPAFAAAFLGATTLKPGFFNPWGAFIAVYFLQTGITGFQLLGVPSYVQQLFYGGALVIAVALSQVVRRREAQAVGGAAS